MKWLKKRINDVNDWFSFCLLKDVDKKEKNICIIQYQRNKKIRINWIFEQLLMNELWFICFEVVCELKKVYVRVLKEEVVVKVWYKCKELEM